MKTASSGIASGWTAISLGLPTGLISNMLEKLLVVVSDNLLMIEVETSISKNATDSQKMTVKLFLREMLDEGLGNEVGKPKELSIRQVAHP
jgi:hypothetical protein